MSRSYVKDGKENGEAYELAKQNYHRYLSEFLVWYVYHRYNRKCASALAAGPRGVQSAGNTGLLTHTGL